MMYGEEDRFGWNALPIHSGSMLQAARRAADAAPTSHVSHLALAQAHYFRKEIRRIPECRGTGDRAQPDGRRHGRVPWSPTRLRRRLGAWSSARGNGAAAQPELSAVLHWAPPFLDAYRRRDYQGARALLPKLVMPGQYFSTALIAAFTGNSVTARRPG